MNPRRNVANILVIDSESIILDLICNTLRLDGHLVMPWSEPLAAVNHAERFRGTLDLILMDAEMHPISDPEFGRRARQLALKVPLILMSGNPNFLSAVAAGPDRFAILRKPFTALHLRQTVKAGLAKRPAASRAKLALVASRQSGPRTNNPVRHTQSGEPKTNPSTLE